MRASAMGDTDHTDDAELDDPELDDPELDDAGLDGQSDDSSQEPDPTSSGRPSTRRTSGGARTPRRGAKLRRTVETAMSVAGLDAATCVLLAAALDLGSDTVESDFLGTAGAADGVVSPSRISLAVAVLEDVSVARATLSALAELISVDDLEAGVLATGMVAERLAFKRLWSVLRFLEPSLPGSIPQKPTQAGAAAARCARGLSKAQRSLLERAIEVLA